MRLHDPAYFANYTRMSPAKFDRLLNLVKDRLETKCFGRKDVVSPGERLALTLRFLATGDGLASMAYAFRLGFTTAHNIIKITCKVLWEVLQPLYLSMPIQDTWKNVEIGYRQKWNFPMCVGAVDGKHVVIQQPPKSGSIYHNYKGTNSVVLMAVVDANYRFITVDIGGYGSSSDGGVFKSTDFGKDVGDNSVEFPSNGCLPKTNVVVPHVLVGDAAFQLLTNFMRPYPAKYLNDKKRIFNYRLSRARRCSENAFGILAARWRIFTRSIPMRPENVEEVVKATIVLHNYLMTEEYEISPNRRIYCPPNFADSSESNGEVINGTWREELAKNSANAFKNLPGTNARNSSTDAFKVQSTFADYFYSKEGAVDWQWTIPGVKKPQQ